MMGNVDLDDSAPVIVCTTIIIVRFVVMKSDLVEMEPPIATLGLQLLL